MAAAAVVVGGVACGPIFELEHESQDEDFDPEFEELQQFGVDPDDNGRPATDDADDADGEADGEEGDAEDADDAEGNDGDGGAED